LRAGNAGVAIYVDKGAASPWIATPRKRGLR
jgi:hypothetical protein